MTLRGHRVILDADLARLYGVTTKALNQALKRNINRFPSDFAFQLIPEEVASLNWSQFVTGSKDEEARSRSQNATAFRNDENRQVFSRRSQFVTASEKFRNPRFLPWVFTEHGALMVANILKSEKAAEMSVYVVRAFVRLRQIVLEHEVLARRVSDMEVSLRTHGEALVDIYEKLEPLLDPPVEEKPDRKMGFGKE
jgi:hypothetical protein